MRALFEGQTGQRDTLLIFSELPREIRPGAVPPRTASGTSVPACPVAVPPSPPRTRR
jgi:hypothetical protein